MAGYLLTTASQVQCPHGGQATLTTSNTDVKADNAFALLETDVHGVSGCPFTVPPSKPQPCVRIEWSAGAVMGKNHSTAFLVQSSVGKCYSGEGALQGVAIVVRTQTKVQCV